MRKATVLLILLIVGTASFSNADTVIINHQGFAWETGGFLPSNSGDVLEFVGIVGSADALFAVDIVGNELTVHVSNLTSQGQVNVGGGFFSIAYTGGNLDLFLDPAKNSDFGINPANATAPSTFIDGASFLQGTLSNFVVFFNSNTGTGGYQANITFTGGSALGSINGIQNNGFTFGGVLDFTGSGGNIPTGYDLQATGTIEVTVIVAVEETTWGSVKSLYSTGR